MTTTTQNITITKVPAKKGGSMIRWNYDLNGTPFGQVWTFKNTATETFRFHSKTLAGAYGVFDTLAAADRHMRGQM